MSQLPSPEVYEISVEDLAALLDDPDKPAFQLIDCREEDEFVICRIEGAHLAPLSRFAEISHLLVADETPIIVYCHHGMRSLNATHYLRQRGHANTWSLAGGIDLWSQKIDPEVPRY